MLSCEFCQLFKNTCFGAHLQTAGFETPGRSSRPEVLCEKDVLRNFAKFTGKHQCQSHSLNKVAGLETLLRKRLCRRCFPVNFAKFLRTPFLQSTSRRLLLDMLVDKNFSGAHYFSHTFYNFFLFSNFFVVPQKVLLRPLRPS